MPKKPKLERIDKPGSSGYVTLTALLYATTAVFAVVVGYRLFAHGGLLASHASAVTWTGLSLACVVATVAAVRRRLQPPVGYKHWWPLLRLTKWAAITFGAGLVIGCATIALVFWMYGRDPKLPNISRLEDYHPKQVTAIVDANDRRIGELFTERRTFVPYAKIPPLVVDAFVAAEDEHFWTHGGIDYTGMARAFFANLRAGRTKEGASTITQQVVKNLLLTPERSFRRKIQEVILARRLEKALTKEEIMTLYLNQIYLGRGRYGIQEASRYYFGKDVQQLDVGEAAVLASLPKEPERLGSALVSMRTSSKVTPMMLYAKDRQNYVIGRLEVGGKLSHEEADKWRAAKIPIIAKPFPELNTSPEWIELAKKELIATKGEAAIDLGGTVRTTMQPDLQQDALEALQAGLRAVDKRHGIGHPVRSVKPDKIDAELVKLAKQRGGEPNRKDVYEAIVTAVHDDDQELEVDLGHWPATLELGGDADARYNPDGKTPSERFKVGDVVSVVVPAAALAPKQPAADTDTDAAAAPAQARPLKHGTRRVAFAPGAQGAVVIMDVKTRKVRALVGGYSARVAGFDRATMAHRQPGSSFKPIVYATAYERAAQAKCHANDSSQKTLCATPATIVNDAPEVFDLWRPKNFETGEYLGPVRLREALAKSINTVSIRLVYDVKPDAVVAMAHRLGVQSELPSEMSLALGAGEVTPLELVNAYATLAAGGVYAPPRFIDAYDGVATPPAQGQQVLAPEIAYVLVDTMRSVVTEGTGAQIGAKLKAPIAGKTGTSNDARDTWFIGATPDYVIGVWIGYDDNRPMPGEQGAKVAAPVFLDIAERMNLPKTPFVRPPHVVTATIDRQTGLLAPDGAPKNTTLDEVFVEGTQPTDTAPKPGEATESSSVTGEYGD